MKKMSVRERQNRRQMMKILGFSAVGVGLAMAGVVGFSQLSSLPVAMEGETLSEKLASGNLEPFVLRLAGAGEWDAVVIGSSDCGFCRAFVAEGLDRFVQEADALGMSVGYLAMANGAGALASTRALTCMKDVALPGAAILKGTYDVAARVSAQSLPAGQVPDMVQTVSQELGVADQIDFIACQAADAGLETTARAQRISQVFQLSGTPSFYVARQDMPTDIRVFSGFSNAEATARQLQRHRTE